MSVPFFFVLLCLHARTVYVELWSCSYSHGDSPSAPSGAGGHGHTLVDWAHICNTHIYYLESQHPFVHFVECLTILCMIIKCQFYDDKNIHLSASQHLTYYSWGWMLHNVKCFGICDQHWSLLFSLTDVLCLCPGQAIFFLNPEVTVEVVLPSQFSSIYCFWHGNFRFSVTGSYTARHCYRLLALY
jgi:hypothetical protein